MTIEWALLVGAAIVLVAVSIHMLLSSGGPT